MFTKNIVSDLVRKLQQIRQIVSNLFQHSDNSSGSKDSSSDSNSDGNSDSNSDSSSESCSDCSSFCGSDCDQDCDGSELSNDDSSDMEYDIDSSDTENDIVTLSPEDIERHTFRYVYKVKPVNSFKRCKNEIEDCRICLSQFSDQEDVRRLRCFHLFHTQCIDDWLKKKELCPNCRTHFSSESF